MNTTIIKSRDLRDDMQKVADAVAKGRSFLVMKQSKPLFKIVRADVDEWGDEGHWTNFDFRSKKYPRGIPADEFLRRMKEFERQNGR
ncbi:MAG: hypothetical protein LBC95_01295 [Candidatus Nomurabacteria bacterium]|jgi:antitoxin (DNA-binding transcriptional repressor) of toxin-antitoxin stability system|nr:hypothetical protein [Candidatus Nomurabacteria bacterium]